MGRERYKKAKSVRSFGRKHVAPMTLDSRKGLLEQMEARNTVSSKKSGNNYLMKFLSTSYGIDAVKSMQDSQITEEFFSKFCTFLCGKKLKQGTILQYIAAAKSTIMEAKPSLALWQSDLWYGNIRSAVQCYTSRVAISNGEAITDKAEPIGRLLTKAICRQFALSDDKAACNKRIAIIVNRLACGRSAELANCTWDLARWDAEQNYLEWVWPDQKTSKQKLVANPPDFDDYYCDFYHGMGEYLIVRNVSGEEIRRWVFNDLFNIVNVAQVLYYNLGICAKNVLNLLIMITFSLISNNILDTHGMASGKSGGHNIVGS